MPMPRLDQLVDERKLWRQILRRRCQFAHQHDQLFLDGEKIPTNEILLRRRAREAERGVEFVHGAVGFNARMMFRHAPAVHQRGGSLVAGFGNDAHG